MIWVNAIWRTGSTYIWHKFRQISQYCCFLEPLHEEMLHLNPIRHREILAGESALLRHPRLTKPYFAEYPVLPGGGVPGYRKRFGYERYALEPGDEDPELEAYISGLMEHARQQGLTPMFQPNRALFRSEWLCQRLGMLHIFLVRDPWEIWRSMISYPNLYFPAAVLNTICQNRDLAHFAPIAARQVIPIVSDPNCQVELHQCTEFVRENLGAMYSIFFYFFTVTTLHNLLRCDVVIDINAVSSSSETREALQGVMAEHGMPLSFEDCNVPTYQRSPTELDRFRFVEDEVFGLILNLKDYRLRIPEQRIAELRPFLGRYMYDLCCRFVSS